MMMFLPMILMMIAVAGIIWLWDEVRRDEETANYHDEVDLIMELKERKVIYPDYAAKRRYYDLEQGYDRKCC